MKVNKAFTLVELLVVTSVVSLLVAILLPSLRAVREKARCVLCASNLRQLVVAENLYADDSDDFFTLCWSDSNPPKVWQLSLDDYLPLKHKDQQFTRDRSDRTSVYCCPSARYTPSQIKAYYASYALNNYINNGNWFYKRTKVCRPSMILFIGDMKEFSFDVFGTTDGRFWWGYGPLEASPGFRHRNRVNMAFVDGHVAELEESELEFDSNHWQWWQKGPRR